MSTENLPDEEAEDEPQGGGGLQADLIASYLAFAGRALRKRILFTVVILVALAGLTVGAVAIWPRTYHCETKLMAQYNWALESKTASTPAPFDGAANTVLRHENVVDIARRAELVQTWDRTRAPLLKLKDGISRVLRGELSDEDRLAVLVAYLESRLSVSVWEGVLSISVDWPDAKSAARIVEVARDTFLEARHKAEISTIQEKITILEGHAEKLRAEIENLGADLQNLREQKAAAAGKALKAAKEADAVRPVISAPAQPRRSAKPDNPEETARSIEELARMKEDLESKKRMIAELEADRNHRLVEAQARLTDLGYKFTPAHPLVRETQQLVDSLSHESPRVSGLRTEVSDLEARIKHASTALHPDEPASVGGGERAAAAVQVGAEPDPLPADILNALDDGTGIDPALTAQLQTAVGKYTSLRSEIGSARVDFDTAEAAFNHRYQVVVPAQVPIKPSKPNVPKVLGIGIAGALLASLLAAVGAELRSGKIVERWQVYHLELPVLAEVRLPPAPGD